jgi:hypothetical protein
MSEAIQVCIQNDPDIIKTASDMVTEKLASIVYQTYHQLNPRGTMTTEDYNYIRTLTQRFYRLSLKFVD